MLRLILLRHSKAARYSSGGDHQRALEPRGIEDATRVGDYLAAEHIVPDASVVSDALRTRQTLEAATKHWREKPKAFVETTLYHADAETLLYRLHETPDRVKTMFVVGHNPGLADLSVELVGYGDRYAMSRLCDRFPTTAMAIIDFDVDHWAEVQPRSGRLDRFVTPSSLTNGDVQDLDG